MRRVSALRPYYPAFFATSWFRSKTPFQLLSFCKPLRCFTRRRTVSQCSFGFALALSENAKRNIYKEVSHDIPVGVYDHIPIHTMNQEELSAAASKQSTQSTTTTGRQTAASMALLDDVTAGSVVADEPVEPVEPEVEDTTTADSGPKITADDCAESDAESEDGTDGPSPERFSLDNALRISLLEIRSGPSDSQWSRRGGVPGGRFGRFARTLPQVLLFLRNDGPTSGPPSTTAQATTSTSGPTQTASSKDTPKDTPKEDD